MWFLWLKIQHNTLIKKSNNIVAFSYNIVAKGDNIVAFSYNTFAKGVALSLLAIIFFFGFVGKEGGRKKIFEGFKAEKFRFYR